MSQYNNQQYNQQEESQPPIDKYEKDSIDLTEDNIREIHLDANYYIHNAILKAQFALTKDNLNDGFIQYIQLVEHIEVLCRSNRILSEKYSIDITAFKETPEYKDEKNELTKMIRLAHKKLEGIMTEISQTKPIFMGMKI